MSNKHWHKFTEHNDHEGETWHFFIKLTEDEFWHIEELLSTTDLKYTYGLSYRAYDEETIDILVEEADEGYMPVYNKCPGPYGDILALTEEDAEEEWYKGRFWL